MSNKQQSKGFVLPSVLGFLVVITIIFLSVVQLISTNIVLVGNTIQSQKAFNIAEAGVNYYLWHLSHNATDYRDGQSTPVTPNPQLGYGPYTHNYVDDNAKVQGTYTLWIKPQGGGSTIVNIRSIGQVANTTVKRTIDAQIGAPSFASYGLVADTAVWFGNTESANGPIHSNQGIRMDGPSNSDVTSTNATYTPPSSLGGDGSSKPGVWCHSSVTSPVNCNTRNKSDWRYPVTSVDFNSVSGSLCTLKRTAFAADAATASLANQANACTQVPNTRTAAYLPRRQPSFDVARGYLIQLNANGTYNLSQVNAENDRNTPYTSALTLSTIANNIAIPTSGVIFAEDNVWVRTAAPFEGRVTIGAARLAAAVPQSANITIADDIVYAQKDGSDAIGLMAEEDILLAPYAPPASGNFTFEVDAALIAQAGSVQYPSEYRTVSTCTRGWTGANQTFTFYGSVATRQSWTWTWFRGSSCGDAALQSSTGNYISGVLNNTTQYDYNMLYTPPPSWPVTSSYNVLSWREVLTGP